MGWKSSICQKHKAARPTRHLIKKKDLLLANPKMFGDYLYFGSDDDSLMIHHNYLDFFNGKFSASVVMFGDFYFDYNIMPVDILDKVSKYVKNVDIDSQIVLDHCVIENDGTFLLHKLTLEEHFHWTAGEEEPFHHLETWYVSSPIDRTI